MSALEQDGFIQARRACRECGCTDEQACVLIGPRSNMPLGPTCSWSEPDLCSACDGTAEGEWLHPTDPGGRIAKTEIAEILRRVDGIRWDRFIAGDGMVQVYGWITRADDRADFLIIEVHEDLSFSFTTSSATETERIAEQLGYPPSEHVPCQRVGEEFGQLVPTAIQAGDDR